MLLSVWGRGKKGGEKVSLRKSKFELWRKRCGNGKRKQCWGCFACALSRARERHPQQKKRSTKRIRKIQFPEYAIPFWGGGRKGKEKERVERYEIFCPEYAFPFWGGGEKENKRERKRADKKIDEECYFLFGGGAQRGEKGKLTEIQI